MVKMKSAWLITWEWSGEHAAVEQKKSSSDQLSERRKTCKGYDGAIISC